MRPAVATRNVVLAHAPLAPPRRHHRGGATRIMLHRRTLLEFGMAALASAGAGKLAVDGVVIVAEHGEYPQNDRGQIMYPRRRFFEEVVKVFKASGRSVPVFTDKHLSYTWENAKWMYDQSRALGFPLMAGSSVPVTWRKPDLQPALGTPWQEVLGVGYSHFEIYGFHT